MDVSTTKPPSQGIYCISFVCWSFGLKLSSKPQPEVGINLVSKSMMVIVMIALKYFTQNLHQKN